PPRAVSAVRLRPGRSAGPEPACRTPPTSAAAPDLGTGPARAPTDPGGRPADPGLLPTRGTNRDQPRDREWPGGPASRTPLSPLRGGAGATGRGPRATGAGRRTTGPGRCRRRLHG